MPVDSPFQFKQFAVDQRSSAMKVGTDGVLLGAWVDASGAQGILDIGTGTGVIAIMLAQRNATAEVVGVEIDQKAGEEAQRNMQSSPFADRLQIVNQAIQDFSWNTANQFDLIVSNPPFFSGGTLSYAGDRNLVRHTAKLSHGDLINSVKRLLAPKGSFSLILPYIEGLRFLELAKRARLFPVRITEVFPRRSGKANRLLVSLSREETTPLKDQLWIREETSEEYTPEYKELTRDFYLNF